MFPFGGSTAAFPLRWHGAQYTPPGRHTPAPPSDEPISEGTKAVVSDILASLGYGNYERGVYDAPQPVLYPVLSGPQLEVPEKPEISESSDQPEFLPGWPEEWIKGEGGWNEDEWVYPPKESDMAIDWGAGASAVIDILQGQDPGGSSAGKYDVVYDYGMGMPTGGVTGNGKVTVDTKTGKVTKCGRRRRRRLLTPTDLNDLAALKTIVGGGQAMNFAVMKAVRR
jgi:hypothetical protein